MTHKINPNAHRLGVIRTWKSKWTFGSKADYKDNLKLDYFVRKYLEEKLRKAYVSSISFERDHKDNYVINIFSTRGGVIAGKDGKRVDDLIKGIKKIIRKNNLNPPKNIKINIEDIKNPYSDAGIVVSEVIESLEKRMPFKRVLKSVVQNVMREKGVQGVKVSVSGRLGGADMARKEFIKQGRIPLSTLRANIDYREGRANLPYGVIGIKVWIYKGEVFNNKDN